MASGALGGGRWRSRAARLWGLVPGAAALRALADNPIAVREWRVLRRRGLDWRIWVGVKWPLDPVVWGAPVVLTYALAPYALWALCWFLSHLRLIPGGQLPLDPFLLLAPVFWIYTVAVSLVLGATAVTQERERQTWDQVRITRLSGRARAAGFLWGRLGPVWGSLLVTSVVWWLLHPHYTRLLARIVPLDFSRGELAFGSLAALFIAVMAGEIGLLASARSQRGPNAVVTAALVFSLAMGLPLLIGPIPFISYVWGHTSAAVGYLASLGTILVGYFYLYLGFVVWETLVAAVERY